MAFRTNKMPVLQEKSASGSVATFNTALAMPLSSCNIAVNAWQEGSGDPSPDNVRPIHGFSEVNATRQGKNLFDKTKYQTRKYINDTTGEIFDISSTSAGISDYIPVKAGEVLFIPSKGTTRNSLFDRNKNVIRYFPAGNRSVTIPNDGYIVLGGYDLNVDTFQLEVGSTATDYEPYVTPTIYTIQLGQEVYGAEVDVVNGVAHCTWTAVDMANLTWNPTALDDFIRWRCTDIKNYKTQGLYVLPTNVMVEEFKLSNYGGASVIEAVGYLRIINGNMYAYTQDTDTLPHGKIAYELDEPFDIQLTPTQIETLIGNNTIFADTGDVDLTYKDLDIAKRGNFREVFKLPS